MSNRKSGIYLRFTISPETIRSGANLIGKTVEMGLGVNRISSAWQLKKSVEKHTRLENRLQIGKGVAEIGTGIATAFTNLLSRS